MKGVWFGYSGLDEHTKATLDLLAGIYDVLFYVDTIKREFKLVKGEDYYLKFMSDDAGSLDLKKWILSAITDPDSRTEMAKVFDKDHMEAMKVNESVSSVYSIIDTRGNTKWYETRVFCIANDEENKKFITGSKHVNALIAKSKDLEKGRNLRQKVLEELNGDFDVVMCMDPKAMEAEVLYTAATNAFGVSETTDARKVIDAVKESILIDDLDMCEASMRSTLSNVVEGHKDRRFVNFRAKINGQVVHYQTVVSAVTINDESKILVGIKNVEREVQEELARNRELQRAKDQAEIANRAKNEFLSHISHDIRTPLNGIVGTIELLKKSYDNPERLQKYVAAMGDATERLISVVNNMLEITYLDNTELEKAYVELELRKFVEDCVTEGKLKAIDKGIKFELQFDIAHENVIGDAVHTRKILHHLIDNAIKFTDSDGRVWVKVSDRHDQGVRFEIGDTGCGMSPEYVSHVGELFTQEKEDQARTDFFGTGLGLAIVKKLTSLAGGTMSVASEEGVGSTFVVELPFEYNTKVCMKSEERDLSKISLEGKRILVVEDNAMNRMIVRELLKEQGVATAIAINGKVAVDNFSASAIGEYDAILMDIMMPEMDGLTATRRIRAMDRSDALTVPIIAMTANAYEGDEQKSMDAGMNAHLTKPIEVQALIDTLKKEIRS